MNPSLPAKHRDPRTDIVPLRYLQLAEEMVKVQQNLDYWNTVAVPVAPTDRVKYEGLRQAAVFLPLLLVAVVYVSAGLLGAGLVLLLALPLMAALHKSVQAAIARAGLEWHNLDKGRHAFTQFMCSEFDLKPEQVTLKLVLKMYRDRTLWDQAAIEVRKQDAAQAELARQSVVRGYGTALSGTVTNGTCSAVARAGVIAVSAAVAVEMTAADTHSQQINPATGLPMLDSVFDVSGNVFGTSNSDLWSAAADLHGSVNGGFADAGGYEWNDS